MLSAACGGGDDLRPPDGASPASGVCAEAPAGDRVTFEIAPDIPVPRCSKARGDQRIEFTNDTGERLTIDFAGHRLTIEPGVTDEIREDVSDFLAPGVHVIAMDTYGGSGPEVWVVGK